MTGLRMKLKNQSKKPLKCKRMQINLPSDEMQLLRNLQSTLKKSGRNKISKTKKSTKSTEEKINSAPKAPKMATRSGSQLKSVPEKLKNFFTQQDEKYFSGQETDDVSVSGKFRKK